MDRAKLLIAIALVIGYTAAVDVDIIALQNNVGSSQTCEEGGRYSCQYNNPCYPELCNEGQVFYEYKNGEYPLRYIQCDGQRFQYCTEQRCQNGAAWNQETLQCEINGVPERCGYEAFNCEDRNPCSPSLCVEGQINYPGNWYNNYMTCDDCGRCNENKCPAGQVWEQETQSCVPKEQPDERCSQETFDCENADPCRPSQCVEGKRYYPHSDSSKYVKCFKAFTVSHCLVGRCPWFHVYDDQQQKCVFDWQVAAEDVNN